MCYIKRAPSPNTETLPVQVPIQDYVFPTDCVSELTWPGDNFLTSPISNPQVCVKSQDSVPLAVIVKRQKNKEAAARSRERKFNRLLELEAQVKALENEKTLLSLQLAISESEKKAALLREEEFKNRIQRLEEYLYKKEI